MSPAKNPMDETESYIKEVETNIEYSFKIIGGLIYKLFFLIAGALEPIIRFFVPEEGDDNEEPF
ncbi:MAG: hypothetical protein ACOC56_04070 [Atribacterota bacterium]